MIHAFLTLIEFVLGLLLLCTLLLFFCQLLLAWSWAQSREQPLQLVELISVAATEWGAVLSVIGSHFFAPTHHHEAPHLTNKVEDNRQIPVILIPSLHTGAGIFTLLFWRLKRHHFKSLWPLRWKTYLKKSELLEDNLQEYIDFVLTRSQSPSFYIVSFGTSFGIIQKVLRNADYGDRCLKWIAISSPSQLTPPLKLFGHHRLRDSYRDTGFATDRAPDTVIHGTHDLLCYPDSVWNAKTAIPVFPLGHYGTLLHPTTVQTLMKELA